MTDPIIVFAQIVYAQREQSLPLAMGRTLVTLPLSLVPDSLTPWRPPTPIGYELVRLTAPARAGSGYSIAATLYGEWWYNWSVFGMLMMVPVLAGAIVLADRRFDRAVHLVGDGRRRLLQLALWAMLCGSAADLAWSGLHTYGARLVTRLPVLLVLLVLVHRHPRIGRVETPSPAPLRCRARVEQTSPSQLVAENQ